MHKIYFEKRCMIICRPDDPSLSDPNAIVFRPGSAMDISALVTLVETTGSLHRICIPSEDVGGMYRRICEEADRAIGDIDASGKTMTVFVPRGATSRAIGQKKRNILRLNEKYCKNLSINRIKILENSSIIGYNIIIDLK